MEKPINKIPAKKLRAMKSAFFPRSLSEGHTTISHPIKNEVPSSSLLLGLISCLEITINGPTRFSNLNKYPLHIGRK